MARLQKIKDADYNVSIWGCECRILLRDTPGLENKLGSHPYVNNCPINIRDALYEGRIEATKTHYRVEEEKKSTMWMSSICTPTFVNMVSLLWTTRKCTWVQTVPLTVWIRRVLSNVRF